MNSPGGKEICLENMRCCRACLSVAGQSELCDYIDLLESHSLQSDSPTLLETFNKYTQLQISLAELDVEGYPPCHYICGRCREDLGKACEFITRAQLNNQLLMDNYTVSQLEKAAEELHKIKQTTDIKERHDCISVINSENEQSEEEYVKTDDLTNENKNQSSPFVQEFCDVVEDDIQIDLKITSVNKNERNDSSHNNQYTPMKVLRRDDNKHEKGKKGGVGINDDLILINGGRKTSFDFKCEFCTSIFEFQRDLLYHYQLDHGDRNLNFPCDVCQNRFVTKNALRLHRRQVHQNDEYIDCEHCGRAVLKSFYNVHFRRHKQIKFLCSKCPKICASRNTLKKHMELHSDDRDRNIECGNCGRRFYTHENLQLHQAVHILPENREVFECTICSKTFLRKTNLGLHMQMHRGETVDCPHCGKKFVRPKDLEVHIRFHTGDFPYSCSMCDRKFAIKGHLNYHEKRHLGVRYKCDECEKTFINLAGLRQHQYEHTGMPLLCGICMRGFPTNFKVRRHLRTVHRYLFKKTGYTDALAKKYITSASKSNVEKNSTELKTVYENSIEMLDEYAQDIPSTLLTN